ncbi:hypothetical protein JL722_2811 [Aureococcus anophagefferens]|nr:hypothetical protein JL722_2811 [Aureococcus anophagefferens]
MGELCRRSGLLWLVVAGCRVAGASTSLVLHVASPSAARSCAEVVRQLGKGALLRGGRLVVVTAEAAEAGAPWVDRVVSHGARLNATLRFEPRFEGLGRTERVVGR